MMKIMSPDALKSFEVLQLKCFDDDFKQILDSCTNKKSVTNDELATAKNIQSLVMNDSYDYSSDNDILRYLDKIKEAHSGFDYMISRDEVKK